MHPAEILRGSSYVRGDSIRTWSKPTNQRLRDQSIDTNSQVLIDVCVNKHFAICACRSCLGCAEKKLAFFDILSSLARTTAADANKVIRAAKNYGMKCLVFCHRFPYPIWPKP